MISGGTATSCFGASAGYVVAAAADEDRKLLAVREVLRDRVPVAIADPYDDAVRALWDGPASPEWDDLVAPASAAHRPAAAGPDDGRAAPPEPTSTSSSASSAPRDDERLGRAAQGGRRARRRARRDASLLARARGRAAHRGRLHAEGDDGDGHPASPPPGARRRQVTAELASELLMSQGWLQRLVDLLAARRQLVLYGPPGTGKTWLARRIAAHASTRSEVRLVQFHPSYTYEDFFEGYRPTTDDGGADASSSRPGPLRELARARRQPTRTGRTS